MPICNPYEDLMGCFLYLPGSNNGGNASASLARFRRVLLINFQLSGALINFDSNHQNYFSTCNLSQGILDLPVFKCLEIIIPYHDKENCITYRY